MSEKYKLIRLTTVDGSLADLLKGLLRFLSSEFEVVGVADDSGRLVQVAEREGVRTVAVPMRREISLLNDVSCIINGHFSPQSDVKVFRDTMKAFQF